MNMSLLNLAKILSHCIVRTTLYSQPCIQPWKAEMPPEQRDPIPNMGTDLEGNGAVETGGGEDNEDEEAPSPSGGGDGGDGRGAVDISAVMASVRTWVIHQNITTEFDVFCDLQGGPFPRLVWLG